MNTTVRASSFNLRYTHQRSIERGLGASIVSTARHLTLPNEDFEMAISLALSDSSVSG